MHPTQNRRPPAARRRGPGWSRRSGRSCTPPGCARSRPRPGCPCGWSSTTSAPSKSSCWPPCSTWPQGSATGPWPGSGRAGRATARRGHSSPGRAQAVIDYHLDRLFPRPVQHS